MSLIKRIEKKNQCVRKETCPLLSKKNAVRTLITALIYLGCKKICLTDTFSSSFNTFHLVCGLFSILLHFVRNYLDISVFL